jgi:hypothetical protein
MGMRMAERVMEEESRTASENRTETSPGGV